jgi:acylphosphatase
MAKHLSITGIVQGVCYRATFSEQARVLSLSGWVRNRSDGSVEALVSGDAQALEKIIAWAWHGPAGAVVEQVTVIEEEDPPLTDGRFHLTPTV